MRTVRLPLVTGLLAAAVLLLMAVAVLHGVAARGHQAEAATHTVMAQDPAASAADRAEMTEHAGVEARIGRLLWVSVAAGLLLVAAGLVAWRRPRLLGGWAVAVVVVNLVMVAAGIMSRSSVGLLGHTDDATRLWAAAVALEVAGALTAAGLVAAVAAVRSLDRSPGIVRPSAQVTAGTVPGGR